MRLINKATGAAITVSDSAARRLGPEWEPATPAKAKPAAKKRPARKRS